MSKAEELALLSLLACIHRDGGHYVNRHGLEKAAKDAEALVIALHQDSDELARLKPPTSSEGGGTADKSLAAVDSRAKALVQASENRCCTTPQTKQKRPARASYHYGASSDSDFDAE